MPVKKNKITTKKVRNEEEDLRMNQMVVQYNPEIVTSALEDYEKLIETKIYQIQRDADFMITSLQHDFQCELFKLPKQVKEMSLKRFTEEFGGNIESVLKIGSSALMSENRNANIDANSRLTNHHLGKATVNTNMFQTPAANRKGNNSTILNTAARLPKEGEVILSANGSPLGEFSTVKKPLRKDNDKGIIPPTPGVFIPLKTGEIVDVEACDVDSMTSEMKVETLNQMEAMMANMKAMMDKLKNTAV
jgi:hypothetical protein